MDIASLTLQPREGGLPKLLWLVAAASVLCAYLVVLSTTGQRGLLAAAPPTLANGATLILVSWIASRSISVVLVGRPAINLMLGHAAFSVAFAFLWYWLLMLSLGMLNSGSALNFQFRLFPGAAERWQILQGLTAYFVVASLTHLDALARAVRREPHEQRSARSPIGAPLLVKFKDELRPLRVEDIVKLVSVGDYTELHLRKDKHLTRMPLTEFERILDDGRFIRVHRSVIVNIEHVVSMEPIGDGRYAIHFTNLESVQSSKAGGKLLRQRTI